MDKTLEQILKLLDKADELNSKIRDKVESSLDEYENDNPSNFERLSYLYDNLDSFKANVKAFSVSDDIIREIIKEVNNSFDYVVCPHTATGYYARKKLDNSPWIIAATADPCKFETIIEPITQTNLPIASQLQEILAKPTKAVEVKADIKEVQKALESNIN